MPDKKREREFEVGMDEFFKGLSGPNLAAWIANMKRTYDEYQDLGVKSARSQSKIADRICQDSENFSEQLRGLAVQSLQNSIENANFAAKGYLERVNGVNAHVYANMDMSSDAFLAILADKVNEINSSD
ncbi:hypothetical protein KAU11_08735 [Candidatus Babeliales bacterium]|nr:hypothetical protein [Candidatus Babeliales bacterium]